MNKNKNHITGACYIQTKIYNKLYTDLKRKVDTYEIYY